MKESSLCLMDFSFLNELQCKNIVNELKLFGPFWSFCCIMTFLFDLMNDNVARIV